jgi:hypothetical protein
MSDYRFINETGTVIADSATVLQDVQAEYKVIFGSDLNVSPSTPQGALINQTALSRIGLLQNNAQLANQINPNLAGGVFLDAILALLGSQRTSETFSTVAADLTGVPGTIIPSGSLAQNNITGTQWALISAVTLDGSGNGAGVFEATEPGEVTANPGTLTIIVSGVLGWETVTNNASATLGSTTQTDEQARNFRKVTLATNSTSTAEAITTALIATPGVSSLSFRENDADTTEVIDNVTMVPHSIYACVDGGTDVDVAAALVSKKSAGAAYNGAVTVPYTVPFSGQVIDVLFDRPTEIPVFARVTAKVGAAIQDPAFVIRESIVQYADGLLSGEPGFVVGADVSPFELAGAINRNEPTIYVQKVEVSYDGASYVTTTLPIEIFERATITASNIFVTLI